MMRIALFRPFLWACLWVITLCSCSWLGPGTDGGTEATPVVLPIYGQMLRHNVPAGFGPPIEDFFPDGNYLRQSFWQNETAARWSQRLTVTGIRDLARDERATLAKLKDYFLKSLQEGCPASFAVASFKDAPTEQIAPGFASEVFVAGCGRSPDIQHGAGSESTLFVLIAGVKDYYSLQWAVRGPASEGPPVFNEEMWQNRLEALLPVRLCPVLPGEEAPYPSCLAEE